MDTKALHRLLAKRVQKPQDVMEILCSCQKVAAEYVIGSQVASDCVCGRGGLQPGTLPPDPTHWQNTGSSARYALLSTLYCALTGNAPAMLERMVFVLLTEKEKEN